MKDIIKEYIKRTVICVSGFAVFGFGNMLGVSAGNVGTNAWNTLSLGISGISGISFGTATLMISGAVVLIDLIGKGKLGFGTLINALLIPFFSDFFLSLELVPAAPNMLWGLVYTLCAQLIQAFSIVLYMSTRLGCGPRDTLMVIIGKKLSRLPIGPVRLVMDLSALVVGVLLGAPFGLGTVLILLLQASMLQFACRVCRFEPRSVAHEDFIDTIKRFKNAKSA